MNHQTSQKPTPTRRGVELKSLRDFVVDNLLCAGRQSYYQRIVIVSKHKKNANMKSIYMNLCTETNKNVLEDKLTGLFLIYRHFGVLLLEGPESVLGKFITKLAAKEEECLEESKIVSIYNNANQRIFNKIISRMGEPLHRVERQIVPESEDTLQIVSKFLRTIFTLCHRINSDDLDDNIFLYLPTSYNNSMPTVSTLDALFTCSGLMDLSTYPRQVYDIVPDRPLYNELIWPAPSHYLSQGFDKKKENFA